MRTVDSVYPTCSKARHAFEMVDRLRIDPSDKALKLSNCLAEILESQAVWDVNPCPAAVPYLSQPRRRRLSLRNGQEDHKSVCD